MWDFVIALPEKGRLADGQVGFGGGEDDTLYGLWLTRELRHLSTSYFYRFVTCIVSGGTFFVAFTAFHSQIINYMYAFYVLLAFHCLVTAAWRATGAMPLEFFITLGWPIAFVFAVPNIVRVHHGLSFVFLGAVLWTWSLDVLKQVLQLLAFLIFRLCVRLKLMQEVNANRKYKNVVEFIYVYGCFFHRHQYAALFIMAVHFCTVLVMIALEMLGGFHSWFLLNGNLRGGLLRNWLGGLESARPVDRPPPASRLRQRSRSRRKLDSGASDVVDAGARTPTRSVGGWMQSFRIPSIGLR